MPSYIDLNSLGSAANGYATPFTSALPSLGNIPSKISAPKQPLPTGGANLGAYAQAATTAMALAGNAVSQSKLDVNPAIVNRGIAGAQLDGYSPNMSMDDIAAQYASLPYFNRYRAKDFRKSSVLGDGFNAATSGLQGFMAGNQLAPGIGGVVGGIIGVGSSLVGSIIGNHKARKAARRANTLADDTMSYNDRFLADASTNLSSDILGKQQQTYTGVKPTVAALGGKLSNVKKGDVIDVTPEEARQLTLSGVQFEILD